MTANKRIFLNIVATYGRSLYALAIGLFSARWVLNSLGVADYGLFGLIGGLTAFISFFNGILAAAISRYYSYAIGAAQKEGNESEGLEECRRWFNTAVSVHTILPLILVAVGYPIGVWAIRNWMVIPVDRIQDCVWLFSFVCASCFVGMVNVPFSAMYGAKQYIAELTIYSFITTTLNFFFLCYMVSHPGYWFLRFGLWTCCLSIVPSLIIAVRAHQVFPECRFVPRYMFKWAYFKQLSNYATWQMIGSFSALLKGQGMALVINKYFGPCVNAAMSIANSVNGHCSTLASSMMGAFYPAIITAYGADDSSRFHGLVLRSCKFGVVLSAIFAVPLSLELPEVMRIWLKNPPAYATGLAAFMLVHHMIENATSGHIAAVQATGKIARYQIYMGSLSLLTLPIAVVWVHYTGWVYGVTWAMICTLLAYSTLRVILTRRIAGVSIARWFREVVLPIACLLGLTYMLGAAARLFMQPCFIRIVITTVICEIVMLPLTWLFILDAEEKDYVIQHILIKIPLVRYLMGRI